MEVPFAAGSGIACLEEGQIVGACLEEGQIVGACLEEGHPEKQEVPIAVAVVVETLEVPLK